MEYQKIAETIIDLKNKDLEFRDKLIRNGQLGKGYNNEMAQLHIKNANRLNEIIDKIGYPTIDKVGKEASEAAWLIIQHAIGQPAFMRKCVKYLENATAEGKVDPRNLAYLTDRIATFEGKPQLYGTSFDWDENGEMSPVPFDDLTKVNERRKAIGLNTVEEQILVMRKQVERENELPPADIEKRKQEYDEWRIKVGWLK